VGAAVGFPAGLLAAVGKDVLLGRNNGGTAVGCAVIGGVTAGGFLVGWAADHRKTTVILVPEEVQK